MLFNSYSIAGAKTFWTMFRSFTASLNKTRTAKTQISTDINYIMTPFLKSLNKLFANIHHIYKLLSSGVAPDLDLIDADIGAAYPRLLRPIKLSVQYFKLLCTSFIEALKILIKPEPRILGSVFSVTEKSPNLIEDSLARAAFVIPNFSEIVIYKEFNNE